MPREPGRSTPSRDIGARPSVPLGDVLLSSRGPFTSVPGVSVVFLATSLVLVSVWLGYPALVGLCARWLRHRREPERRVDWTPTVTVVIATIDEAPLVRRRVENVLEAAYPADRLNVVVGADRSVSWRPEEVSIPGGRVTVVPGDPPGGKAANLNAAVRAARGEVLVLTDSAQRFESDTIARIVAALGAVTPGRPPLGAVSGALQTGGDAGGRTLADGYWQLEKWLRRVEADVHSAVGVTGAIYAMRRADWEPLPPGLILDDVYVPMRLVLRGRRIGFEPAARAHDDRRFTPARELQRKARTLTGVLQLCAWLPDVLVPGRNPIWAQFVFHKLLRFATPYLVLLAALSGGAVLGQGLLAHLAPAELALVVAGALASGGLLLAWRPVRAALQMGVAMQVAVVRATLNGLRGEWDVWSR